MKNKNQQVFAAILILLGVMLLIGEMTNVDIWAFFWPVVLIGLGLWMIFRPALSSRGLPVIFRPLADIKRDGEWVVEDQEIWIFVGDVDLDLTRAVLPHGETKIRLIGFVGDVDLLVPMDVGIAVSSNAFVTNAKVLGEDVDNIIVPFSRNSVNYTTSERKLVLESYMFVTSIKVKQF